jgi:uncharacterized protein YfdQ (DUF2303 family)
MGETPLHMDASGLGVAVQKVAAMAQAVVAPINGSADVPPTVIVPAGYQVVTLTENRAHPRRKVGTTSFIGLMDFIEHLKKHQVKGHTEIFQDTQPDGKCTIRAVIDGHAAGLPGHGEFISTYCPMLSEELRNWKKILGGALTQEQFLDFLEDNAGDVMKPDPLALQSAVKALELTRNVGFKSAINLDNGSCQLSYINEVNQTKASMEVPTELTIMVPLTYGAAPIPLVVKIRVRLLESGREAGVRFYLRIPKLSQLFATINREARALVKAETGLPVWLV